MGSSAKMISRPAGQRPGDGDALLLAAGELATAGASAGRRGRRSSTTLSSHAWSGLRPASVSGSVMFSSAVSVGTRLNAWKTKPMRSRRSRVSCLSSSVLRSVSPMNTCPDVSVSRPARQCMQRRLARARRAHDRGEPAAREVDGRRRRGRAPRCRPCRRPSSPRRPGRPEPVAPGCRSPSSEWTWRVPPPLGRFQPGGAGPAQLGA